MRRRLVPARVAPLLLLSGGGRHETPEAAIMRRLAEGMGVPPAAIVTEPRSRNTYENSIEVAHELRARLLSSIVLVSDAYHLPRARRLFRRSGIVVAATHHPPRQPWPREARLWVREAAATALGLLRGRLTGPAGNRRRSSVGGREKTLHTR